MGIVKDMNHGPIGVAADCQQHLGSGVKPLACFAGAVCGASSSDILIAELPTLWPRYGRKQGT